MKNFLLVFSLFTLFSCSSKQLMVDSAPYRGTDKSFSEATGETAEVNRKIIKNAYLRMEVKDLNEARKTIEGLAEQYQGYVQAGDMYKVTLRIHADLLDDALTSIEQIGKVEQRDIRTKDVTGQYYDLEARIESVDKSRQRYLEILEQGDNVQDILAVERELERVTQELEVLKGQYTRMKDQVAMATIDVTLKEKIKPGPVGYVFVGLYEGIKWLFVRN